ncbi:MAG TPA: DUF721 domain-containing protein [Alphaproteobacteria bacterium]|nr:DUF721 domain-containing protein [Alphaproteobacteria bacterium]
MSYESKKRSFKTVSIGELVPSLIAPALEKQGVLHAKLFLAWDKIFTQDIYKICKPVALYFPKDMKNQATLKVSTPVAMATHIRYMQDIILEKVNIFFGYNAVSKLWIEHETKPTKNF